MPHLAFHRHEALRYLVEHTDETVLTIGASTDIFRDPLYGASMFPNVHHAQTTRMTADRLYDLVTTLRPDIVFYEPDAVERDVHNAIYRTAPKGCLYQIDDASPRHAETALLERFETAYRNVLAAWATGASPYGAAGDILGARQGVRRERDNGHDAIHPFDPPAHIVAHFDHILRAERRALLVEEYDLLMKHLAAMRAALPYVTLPGDLLTSLHRWEQQRDA